MSDNDVSKPNRVIKGSIKSGAAWEIYDLIKMGNFNAKSLFDSRHKELEPDGRKTLNVKHNAQEEIDKKNIKISYISNTNQKILTSSNSDNNPMNLANPEQTAIHKSDTELKISNIVEDSTDSEKKEIIPPNSEDIKKFRDKRQVHKNKKGKDIHTIAVCRADIEGLEDFTSESGSSTVRKNTKPERMLTLDEEMPNRNFKPPANHRNAMFINHAEEGVLNSFDTKIEELRKANIIRLKPEEIEGMVYIHQSNPRGVCYHCLAGLIEGGSKELGIVKQASLKYPKVKFVYTSDMVEGTAPKGKLNFTVQNGKIIEEIN